MRQVPRYLLIGNGRISRHFQHYFSLLQLPYSCWHRQQPIAQLEHELQHASHVLILIRDQAIEAYAATHLRHSPALRIHFSGSLITDQAFGAHPLSSFSESLWSLDQYQKVPFILDHDAPDFEKLLPGLPNPHVRLHKSFKPKYHALCVLSGNFTCLLWQKFFTHLTQEFHIPTAMAYPFLQQITQNLLLHPEKALTGPLVRNDVETIEKNLRALEADPYQEVYQSFVQCYQKMMEENEHE